MKYTEAFFSLCTGLFAGVFLHQYKSERELQRYQRDISNIQDMRVNEFRKNQAMAKLWDVVKSSKYVFFLYVDSVIPFYENGAQTLYLKDFLKYTYISQFKFYLEDFEKLVPLMEEATKVLRKSAQHTLSMQMRDFVERTSTDFPMYEFLVKFLIHYFGIFFVMEGTPEKLIYYINKERCNKVCFTEEQCHPKMFTDICAFLVTVGCSNIAVCMIDLVYLKLKDEFKGEEKNLNYILKNIAEIYNNNARDARSDSKNSDISQNSNNFEMQLLHTQQILKEGDSPYIPSYEIGNFERHDPTSIDNTVTQEENGIRTNSSNSHLKQPTAAPSWRTFWRY